MWKIEHENSVLSAISSCLSELSKALKYLQQKFFMWSSLSLLAKLFFPPHLFLNLNKKWLLFIYGHIISLNSYSLEKCAVYMYERSLFVFNAIITLYLFAAIYWYPTKLLLFSIRPSCSCQATLKVTIHGVFKQYILLLNHNVQMQMQFWTVLALLIENIQNRLDSSQQML